MPNLVSIRPSAYSTDGLALNCVSIATFRRRKGHMNVQVIRDFQKNEITEHVVYQRLSQRVGGKNGEVLKRISEDELRHYNEWMKYTQTEVQPNGLLVLFYIVMARILGLTFAIKLMERNEEKAERLYAEVAKEIPEAEEILKDELEHEALLVDMIDEERMVFISLGVALVSFVIGWVARMVLKVEF